MPLQFEEYLGDGLYAGFDGYQIILSANGRLGPYHMTGCTDKVALEPGVVQAFFNYVKRLREAGVSI